MKTIFTALVIMLLATNVSAQSNPLQEGLVLKYLVQLPERKSAHPPVIILLHGYGSDEKDLFELRNFFPKNYLIVSAQAPYKLAGGGYEWYEMTDIGGVHDGNTGQLANSRKLIALFIKQVISKYNADPKQVYLMGFSQGAIMSYQVGLTQPAMLHGIGVLSGTIYPSLKPLVKVTPDLKRLRIFASHGTTDNRISYTDGKSASDYLLTFGLKSEFHRYNGMGHSINKDVIADLLKWLK